MALSAIVRAVKRTLAVEFCYCSVDMCPGMNIVRRRGTLVLHISHQNLHRQRSCSRCDTGINVVAHSCVNVGFSLDW